MTLEKESAVTIDSLKESNTANRYLLTAFSALLAILVTVQGAVSVSQSRRESRRDAADRVGVDRLSDILGILHQTLVSRLDAETEAREQAKQAHEEMDSMRKQFGAIEVFFKRQKDIIEHARLAIEETATVLSETPRHGFRSVSVLNELRNFSQRVDAFMDFAHYEQEQRPFSTRVLYIQGVAAHYSNKPEFAKKQLEAVVISKDPESNELKAAFDRRVATAYYFLGLIESNFDNYEGALSHFEQARVHYPSGQDVLTKILTADVYVMDDKFDKAATLISEVEKALPVSGGGQTDRRQRSRAKLLKASMFIRNRQPDWPEEAARLVNEVYQDDPLYYYATATLAQIRAQQKRSDDARQLFREAYEAIEHSGDLVTVTEVRIRILLLMVAGMCGMHGDDAMKVRAEDHLQAADGLRESLPKIGTRVCTVFSHLGKRNESSENIHLDIERIRNGELFHWESGK